MPREVGAQVQGRRKARPGAGAGSPTETELKLKIGLAAAAALPRHPTVLACKRTRARRNRLISTYYDTSEDDLVEAGIVLRLRAEGGRFVQAVKGRADGVIGGGVTRRPEFQWPVASPALDPALFAGTPFRRVLMRAYKTGLVPRFITDFTRSTIPLEFADGTHAALCIDVGSVRTGSGPDATSEPIAEIELELEAGDVARLYEFAQLLAADVPLVIEPLSKAQRGYRLRSPSPARPRIAGDPVLARNVPARAALSAIIGACLAQIEGNAAGVVASDDPEWIHQMRIGVRRLRAALSLLCRCMPAPLIEPLRVELRWLAGSLGPARDLDVFALQTLPAFRSAVRRGATAASLATPLRSLAARGAARRRDARAIARASIASPRFLRLVLAAGALGARLAAGDPMPELDLPARDFGQRVLKRRHRRVAAMGSGLADAAPAARHAVRLAAKNLRYATEFFAPLFPKKRTRTYRRALALLQDELGAWNDAAVAAALAAEIAGSASAAAAAFSGWAAAQDSARHDALQSAWDKFHGAATFWSHK